MTGEATTDLVRRAQGGDREAFAALVEPHERELRAHCYRMLASLQDAEDAVQDTLLAAWVGIAGFEGRSSVRTWLHRIATNRCLNHLRAAGRRPAPAAVLPEPTGRGEVFWLQPYPDDLLEGLADESPGPEVRYESREAISLAFVTAVQMLPPNQRAVLLLRDVLGYRAAETAAMLSLTEQAVTSALKRARATTANHRSGAPPPPGGPGERELLERFVTAFVHLDVEALVALMTDDIWLRMPPHPFEYHGIDAARRFFTAVDAPRRRVERLVPVRVNRQPAWGVYHREPATGVLRLAGIEVVALAGDRVCEITRFDSTVAPHLGLPRTLPPD